ncbi:hypothetical protein [Nocardioides sp. L-11A]|uniref:hypothetical protein n=1 Tax=Nocardioides sp. L-11A TaxID=3043848 RepID=UPI00249AA7E8|nr:hypothetical protein QJ852_09980 [Nocardioides sp. L-11A]
MTSTTPRQPLVVLPFDFEAVADEVTTRQIDAQRHLGVRTAVELLVAGRRSRAHYELVRSVRRQWKAACGGEYPIEPSPLPRDLPRERSTR